MNSIVILLQGCPTRWLGPYGNEWIATPNLDRFAAQGIVFDRHISENPTPLAARDAIMSQSVQARLRSTGCHTALVRANRGVNDLPSDFYVGWDKVFDARPNADDVSPSTALVRSLPSILNDLNSHENWMLWIEWDVLLAPWDVPREIFEVYIEDLLDLDVNEEIIEQNNSSSDQAEEPLIPWNNPQMGWFDVEDIDAVELLQRSFAAAVTAFDADFGRVFEQLDSVGALTIVTSDCGWAMGEHGILGPHRPWLHTEVTHLPLLVRLPNREYAGNRVSRFTVPSDLATTLLDWHGLGGEGSLRSLWSGSRTPLRTEVRSDCERDGARERSLRTVEWTLLLPISQHVDDLVDERTPKLYAMPDDRHEVNDLATRQPDVVEELMQKLDVKPREI
jgi:arylsulfatase A-like enzyme